MLVLGSKIIVVEWRGWAIGAGFSWVLNGDVRICGATAQASFPEVGFGSFVTGGASLLAPHVLGARRATELLLLGARVKVSDGEAESLAQAVHADDEVALAAQRVAQTLAELPQPAARLMKQAITGPIAPAFEAALDREVEACVATTLDPGTLARMRAAIARG